MHARIDSENWLVKASDHPPVLSEAGGTLAKDKVLQGKGTDIPDMS